MIRENYLIWEASEGAGDLKGDVKARDPQNNERYYSVYQAVLRYNGAWWYYGAHTVEDPTIHGCSSIDEGMRQAEAAFRDRYKNDL